MGNQRDYGREDRDRNSYGFKFDSNPKSLGKRHPERDREPLIPVEEGFYTPGEATAEADRVLAEFSWEMSEQEQQQQVAFAHAVPVVVIGGVVLIAAGSVLLLQVEDDNGRTVTINEYASRPVADLLEQITNDVRNYYRTEAKDKIVEIRAGVSSALNRIVVTEEPEEQIYTTPEGEQGKIEHTGHAPPEVETGTPGVNTGQQVETQRHTGHGQAEQQTAEDFVMESRRDVDSHDNAGGHTRERHIGKSVSWLQKRAATLPRPHEASSFIDTASANLIQARAVKENQAEIEAYLASDRGKPMVLDAEMNREIGKVVNRSGKVWKTKKAKIVITKDNSSLGYKILTSYPVK